MLGQRISFSMIKLFSGKNVSFIYPINAIFNDRILFKQIQSSIEIDVILFKKHIYF